MMQQAQESQALTTSSFHLIAAELERRSIALSEAQATIERLAREAGRNEERERELDDLQKRLAALAQESHQIAQEPMLRERIKELEANQARQAEQIRGLEARLAALEKRPTRPEPMIPRRPVRPQLEPVSGSAARDHAATEGKEEEDDGNAPTLPLPKKAINPPPNQPSTRAEAKKHE
jgi:hypothetical protein